MSATLAAAVLIGSIVLQALLPGHRLLVVLGGAALAVTGSALAGTATPRELFAEVPWDVLVILVSLGLYTEALARSRLFSVAALAATRLAGGRPMVLLGLATLGTWAVSGLVNNLTALLVILPVVLSVLALLGVTARYASWSLGLLLVACNLGGAATPIGDFPAVLLLGRGELPFLDYLLGAAPATFVALLVLFAVIAGIVRPARELPASPLRRDLTLATLARLYRGVRVEPRRLVPGLLAMAAMLLGWLAAPASWGLTPELVAWLGAGVVLVSHAREGEALLRARVDVEAALFLLALFLMVGAVRRTGLFGDVAEGLAALPLPPALQLVVFLVVGAVLTGLFSAGPSMAALLEVAEVMVRDHPREPVFVGLALAVCAGSSLVLTAATSGPLTQSLVERAGLRGLDGAPIRFGFREFLPVGLVAFVVILGVAIARTLLALPAAAAPAG